MSDVPDEARLERYCALMHDAYEDAAHENGWASQVGAIPWAEVPEANKATMRVAVGALLAEVAAERQRLRDRIEAERRFQRRLKENGPMPEGLSCDVSAFHEETYTTTCHCGWVGPLTDYAWHVRSRAAAAGLVRALVSEASASSPVSDDTCDDLTRSPRGSLRCNLPRGHDGMHRIDPSGPVSDDTGGTKP